jgi:Tol biopolymer transport system component
VLSTCIASHAQAQSALTSCVSISSAGAPGDSGSLSPAISKDGRYVAFQSYASTLVAGDTNGKSDIFVRDRWTDTTTRISLDSNGIQSDGNSFDPALSADGRYVAFSSDATNLVPGDTNGLRDIFVRDNATGHVTRVSVDSVGGQADGASITPVISADGRFVAFASFATNLVHGDGSPSADVFVHDNVTGTTTRVSVSSTGVPANDECDQPSICGDGHLVAFRSFADNLVPGDTNNAYDVFVHDLTTGRTTRVSLAPSGVEGNGDSVDPRLSESGRLIVFSSAASNMAPGDGNNQYDVFVRNLATGEIELVSTNAAGQPAGGDCRNPAVSADERWIAFESGARSLADHPHNFPDVYVHDRVAAHTEKVSVSTSGVPGNYWSMNPCLSGDGRLVAFASYASNLVDSDPNGYYIDVFTRDQLATGATSVCDPRAASVIPCPCGNPASGPGRGCDNSFATGGASIAVSGFAYLSMDSVVFSTSAETPTATSIVVQGDAVSAGGIVFGQGVRCAAGSLLHLYTKPATSGAIMAPDFGVGDSTVSARSTALGDVIRAGDARWYFVYYRDATVLDGCPAASTFNATQTMRIAWSL